jgi:hypothetical protein
MLWQAPCPCMSKHETLTTLLQLKQFAEESRIANCILPAKIPGQHPCKYGETPRIYNVCSVTYY